MTGGVSRLGVFIHDHDGRVQSVQRLRIRRQASDERVPAAGLEEDLLTVHLDARTGRVDIPHDGADLVEADLSLVIGIRADIGLGVGIAEEHALTFAAGLAANKMRPCAAIYSTFMQRAYDNIIHDVALQELPVLMLIDRAGINLKDGATHHGLFDVAFLSHIPNIRIYTPISNKGLRASIDEALTLDQPCAIRYPSGVEDEKAVEVFYNKSNYSDISLKTDFDLSVVDELDVLIVTHGRIVSEALKVEENLKDIRIGIVLLEVLKPYDECAERIFPLLGEKLKAVLFYEEEIKSGGMGMNLADIMRYELADRNIKYDILAIKDNFATVSKEGQNAYQMAGVDYKIAIDKILKML